MTEAKNNAAEPHETACSRAVSDIAPLISSRTNHSLFKSASSTITVASSNDSNSIVSESLVISSVASRHRETKGLWLSALSALLFSLMSVLVKKSAAGFPSFEIVFARSVMQFALVIPFAFRYPLLPPAGVRKYVFARGLCGSIGLAMFYYGISVLPLADATVIFFTAPVFTAICARILLKEPFDLLDGIASSICLVGVTLISRPRFLFPASARPSSNSLEERQRVLAVILLLLGSLISALAYCCVRKAGNQAHFLSHVFSFGLISTLLSPIGLVVFQQTPVLPKTCLEWLGLASVGVAAFLGQCLNNKALQLCPAGPVLLMRNLDVLFAFMFGLLWFGEVPHTMSVLGATLVMVGVLGIGIKKWMARNRGFSS